MASRKITDKVTGIKLTAESVRFLTILRKKFPEMNTSAIIRMAIRELAEKEKAA